MKTKYTKQRMTLSYYFKGTDNLLVGGMGFLMFGYRALEKVEEGIDYRFYIYLIYAISGLLIPYTSLMVINLFFLFVDKEKFDKLCNRKFFVEWKRLMEYGPSTLPPKIFLLFLTPAIIPLILVIRVIVYLITSLLKLIKNKT